MSKGILGSIAALLVSSGLISAQVPVYNGPPPDGGQAPPPLNHMEGPGDFHPGHADAGHPGGPGDFQQGGVPGGWPPFWIRGEWLYMQIKNQPLPVPLITQSGAEYCSESVNAAMTATIMLAVTAMANDGGPTRCCMTLRSLFQLVTTYATSRANAGNPISAPTSRYALWTTVGSSGVGGRLSTMAVYSWKFPGPTPMRGCDSMSKSADRQASKRWSTLLTATIPLSRSAIVIRAC